MPIKDKLLALIQEGVDEQHSFIQELGAAELHAEGTPERWSAKDILAHIGAWKENMVQELEGGPVSPAAAWEDDVDATNARLFELQRRDPPEKIVARLEEADRHILATVRAMSEEGLADPARNLLRKDRPAWVRIAENSFTHPLTHIGAYAFEHGDPQRGARLYQRTGEGLMELDNGPRNRSTALYNTACAFALSGQSAEALPRLRAALDLNPELVDWSRKDPDLVSLHGDPQYEGLYLH